MDPAGHGPSTPASGTRGPADLLTRLKALDRPIRMAVVGAGSTGEGLFYQSHITPGFTCVGMADIDLGKAVAAAERFGRPYRVVSSAGEVEDAVAAGLVPLCEDASLLAASPSADVLVDCSSAIADAGRHLLPALDTGKHLVMMNAEADLLFGPHLARLAADRGLVYTTCDGDQPGCIARLVDEITLWGFELVMAGNIKGFLDRYTDPTKIIPEATKRFLDPKMCASYTDGSKLCVEMALVANAYGLRTLVPGMHGPRVERLPEIFDHFDFEAIRAGGVPVVDYVLGARPKGGVFVVGYSGSEYQRSMLGWFPGEHGNGPFFVFDRPYHLVHVEAMRCVAEAVLDGTSLLEPWQGMKTDVYAYAKRDLRAGERLDGIGGYTCYGLIENCADNLERPGISVCLADGVHLVRDIAKDEKVFLDDVTYDPARSDFQLYESACRVTSE